MHDMDVIIFPTDNDCAAVHPRGQPAGLPQVQDDAGPGRVLLAPRRATGGQCHTGIVRLCITLNYNYMVSHYQMLT